MKPVTARNVVAQSLALGFIVCVSALLASCSGVKAGAGSGARSVSLARVIRIPVRTLVTPEVAAQSGHETNDLIVSAAAPDEPPEGPDGFDVLEDGSVAITDPFRKRIAIFDSAGKFRQEWNIG